MARTPIIVYATEVQLRKLRGVDSYPIRIKQRAVRGQAHPEVAGYLILSAGRQREDLGGGYYVEEGAAAEPDNVSTASDITIEMSDDEDLSVEQYYEKTLRRVMRELGEGVTRARTLNTFGKKHIHQWGGVFDSVEPIPAGDVVCVKNTGRRQHGGEHWVAIIRDSGTLTAYDSFGRVVMIDGEIVRSPEYDAEQLDTEENCGQRSLAWLLTAQEYGVQEALKI